MNDVLIDLAQGLAGLDDAGIAVPQGRDGGWV
jgi:hypothetical protein